jgi:catechol 2,3-dioxygenase-like lactoylglutathione lyase family enzyme
MGRTTLERLHNPGDRVCGCDPDCWCQRNAIGRAVRWWFPGRYFGMPHKSAASTQWKRDQAASALGVRAAPVASARAEYGVDRLVPFVKVADVQRSIDFYGHLGFVVASVVGPRGNPAWAALDSGGAEVMFERGDPVDPGRQGTQFYLYSHDLRSLRAQLIAAGVRAGEIEDGSPGPREEMRLVDPDGYVLMVAQIEP